MGTEIMATLHDGGNGVESMPILSLGELRARLSVLWEKDVDYETLRACLPPLLYDLCADTSLGWSYGRMFQASCRSLGGDSLNGCAPDFKNSGMGWDTEFLTLNTSESPHEGVESSLSESLEVNPVPQRYFLTPRQSRYLLRKAKERKKRIPVALKAVLEQCSRQDTETTKKLPEH